MKTFEKQIFDGYNIGYHVPPQENGPEYSDMSFIRCEFHSCTISHHIYSPASRAMVKNISLIQCHQRSSMIGSAIFEDVLIDGLKTHGLLMANGAVFKNVKFTGRIGRIFFRNSFPVCADDGKSVSEDSLEKLFTSHNKSYYNTIDMAIDISEAEFEGECDIGDIPAGLIKIDPETQCRVMKKDALGYNLDSIDFLDTYYRTSIRFLLESDDDGVVLVASKHNKKKFANQMKVIETLKKIGIAKYS